MCLSTWGWLRRERKVVWDSGVGTGRGGTTVGQHIYLPRLGRGEGGEQGGATWWAHFSRSSPFLACLSVPPLIGRTERNLLQIDGIVNKPGWVKPWGTASELGLVCLCRCPPRSWNSQQQPWNSRSMRWAVLQSDNCRGGEVWTLVCSLSCKDPNEMVYSSHFVPIQEENIFPGTSPILL